MDIYWRVYIRTTKFIYFKRLILQKADDDDDTKKKMMLKKPTVFASCISKLIMNIE